MANPVKSPSAFTEVKLYSKVRLDAAKERVDSDVEKLIKATQEAIQRLEIENEALKGRIVVLEENSRKEALIKKTAHELLQKELGLEKEMLDLEKERRLQAERERDLLLDAFSRRRIPTPDISSDVYSPGTYEYLKNAAFSSYNSWQDDYNQYLKIKAKRK